MSAGAGEVDGTARLVRGLDAIDRKEVAADVAFPEARPRAFEWVVPSFGPQRAFVGNEAQHDRLEPSHIVPART